jgi:hypothetical protein
VPTGDVCLRQPVREDRPTPSRARAVDRQPGSTQWIIESRARVGGVLVPLMAWMRSRWRGRTIAPHLAGCWRQRAAEERARRLFAPSRLWCAGPLPCMGRRRRRVWFWLHPAVWTSAHRLSMTTPSQGQTLGCRPVRPSRNRRRSLYQASIQTDLRPVGHTRSTRPGPYGQRTKLNPGRRGTLPGSGIGPDAPGSGSAAVPFRLIAIRLLTQPHSHIPTARETGDPPPVSYR